eukprot:1006085-Prymnesium_polylepis.1
MNPTAVCGPFCGFLSTSVLGRRGPCVAISAARSAEAAWWWAVVTLWRLERRCATRCGAAAND